MRIMKKDSGLGLQRNVRPKKIDQTFKKIDRTEKAGVVWLSGLTGRWLKEESAHFPWQLF